jgi:hypothetical protein
MPDDIRRRFFCGGSRNGITHKDLKGGARIIPMGALQHKKEIARHERWPKK